MLLFLGFNTSARYATIIGKNMRNLYGDSCEGNNYGDNWEGHCFKIILYPSCFDGILEIVCLIFSEGTEMVHWIQIA